MLNAILRAGLMLALSPAANLSAAASFGVAAAGFWGDLGTVDVRLDLALHGEEFRCGCVCAVSCLGFLVTTWGCVLRREEARWRP